MSMRHLVWSLAVAGCFAEDPITTPDAGESTAALTQAEAKIAGEALAAGIEETAKRYGPVLPAATFAPSCMTTSGDLSDVDGDTIPANAEIAFDCSDTRLGYTGTLTGTEAISDGQPDARAWAFAATADLRASLTGPFGGSMVVDTDGSIEATQGGLLGPFQLVSTLGVVSVITNVRGQVVEVTEDVAWTVSYAPDVEWAPGGVVVTGTLAAEGSWNVGLAGKSVAATLATPMPLTFDPSCKTRVTAGRIDATFAIGASVATISVSWSGCGQSAVTYDPGSP